MKNITSLPKITSFPSKFRTTANGGLEVYGDNAGDAIYPTITIGTINSYGFTDEQFKANCAFIVTACNSHSKLVEALKDAVERMNRARGILNRNTDAGWGMLDTRELCMVLDSVQEGEKK